MDCVVSNRMTELKEETILLPLDLVERSPGFSLDIGASTGKLIYRSNKCYKDGKLIDNEKEKNHGYVNTVIFPRDDISIPIRIIKQHCDVTWQPGDQPIKTTGVGANYYQATIEQQLGVKLHNVSEFDCLVDALLALTKSKEPNLMIPIQQEAIAEADILAKYTVELKQKPAGQRKLKNYLGTYSNPTENEIKFPCIVVVCGSACACLQVKEDGQWTFFDSAPIGGKFFQGLASIILGKKDYKDILEELLSADGETCDVSMASNLPRVPKQQIDTVTKNGNPELGFYEFLASDKGAEKFRLFPLGKAINTPRDKIKDADVVRSMCLTMCDSVAHTATLVSANLNIDHIYFVGNLVKIPQVQQWITEVVYRRIVMGQVPNLPHFQFLNHGGVLSVIGAFMS